MKWLIAILAGAIALAAWSSSALGGQDRSERILTAVELEKGIAPHVPQINACYKKHGIVAKKATGHLRLELLIDKQGRVRLLDVLAPGVKGKQRKKLAACIDKLKAKIAFAPKPGFTRAVIPFHFLRTKVKGAGPLHTCWRRKGCPIKNPNTGFGPSAPDKGKSKGKDKKPKKAPAKKKPAKKKSEKGKAK